MKYIIMAIQFTLIFAIISAEAFCETMPFTFIPGTQAKANEVNENFQFVNYGNIVVVDGNGVELGTFLGGSTNSTYFNYLTYLNDNNYIVSINTNGRIFSPTSIYYTLSGCTGDSYAKVEYLVFPIVPNTVISHNNNIYYTNGFNGGATSFLSLRNSSGACGDSPMSSSGLTRVYLDSSNITGESSVSKATPIRIIRRGR